MDILDDRIATGLFLVGIVFKVGVIPFLMFHKEKYFVVIFIEGHTGIIVVNLFEDLHLLVLLLAQMSGITDKA